MIDPDILLQSKPVSIETPNDAALGAQSLQNLANQGQIQRGTIAQQAASVAATEQENQQRQMAIDNQQATNAAIAQNIKTGADGNPYIDHSGVVTTLTSAGKGVAALDYQKNATAVQQGVTALQEANQKLAQAHAESIASVAAAVDSAPTPQAKAAIYAMGIHSLTANHQIQPGEMPANYDPSLDPMIKGWAKMGISAQQQTQDANAASLADSSARRADAAEKRADVAQDRADAAADAESWKPSGTRGGKQVYYNSKTGEEKLGGPVDMAPDKASGQNGSSLTPDAQAIEDRAKQKAADDARAQMDNVHAQRTAIGGALAVQNGSHYIDPRTHRVAPDPMDDATRANLQQQFQNITNLGRRLQARWGFDELGPDANAPTATAPAAAPPKPAAGAAAAPRSAVAAPTGYRNPVTDGKGNWMAINAKINKYEPIPAPQ